MTSASPSQAQKDAFIAALLVHIPFDGWSMHSMQMAAKAAHLNADEMQQLFPEGIADALIAYGAYSDRQMVAHFNAHFADNALSIAKTIRQLILIRLEQAIPHKEATRRTLALLAQPAYAPVAVQLLYNTVDEIWYQAGDRTTDFNFYSKRASLSAIYSATLLAFLADESPDMSKTTAFLDRRLADIAQIPKLTRPVKQALSLAAILAKRVPTPFRQAR